MSSHNRNISKINLEGKSVGDLCVEAKTRDLTFLIDEPLAIGGTNLGPSPTESALASLMSCVSMVIRVIAKKKN